MSPERSAVITVTVLIALLNPVSRAWADTTLKEVCGPQGHSRVAGSQQAEQLCQAAYVNGNAWVLNDNNARVRASVAVVCAYKCIAGGIASCSDSADGTSGSSCSVASSSGYKAYDYSNSSDAHLAAAQHNGGTAQVLESSVRTFNGNGLNRNGNSESADSGGDPAAPGSLPEVCQSAGKNGSASDRIACAAQTDPTLPKFVQSPEFLADFQTVTGRSLQEVINKSGETVLSDYAGGAMKNAVSRASEKLSPTEFLKGGVKLLQGMLGNFGSDAERGKFLTASLPSSLRGMLPESLLAGVPAGNGRATDAIMAMNRQEPSAQPSGAAAAGATSADGRTLVPRSAGNYRTITSFDDVNSPENNSSISLFDRVTAKYQRAIQDRRIYNAVKVNTHFF